jgi:two-component system, probable response regulator PhcQ
MTSHAVLIVDDEKNVLHALQRALRREPYTTLTALGAEEGYQLLSAREVSIVVCDYTMPFINGMEFLKQVKQTYPHILSIMLTGQAEMDVAIQAINEAGVYKFILKPWNDEDLRVTLRRALESLDLVNERDHLLRKIKSRDAILGELERKYPGITRVERDEDGYMTIGE